MFSVRYVACRCDINGTILVRRVLSMVLLLLWLPYERYKWFFTCCIKSYPKQDFFNLSYVKQWETGGAEWDLLFAVSKALTASETFSFILTASNLMANKKSVIYQLYPNPSPIDSSSTRARTELQEQSKIRGAWYSEGDLKLMVKQVNEGKMPGVKRVSFWHRTHTNSKKEGHRNLSLSLSLHQNSKLPQAKWDANMIIRLLWINQSYSLWRC